VAGEFGLSELIKINTTTQFSNNQERFSEQKKRAFREAVRKAADEYKSERKLEIKQADSFESVEEETREIANPNNEITVTYLFYELQRRFKVSEQLHRVRPVILVANEVPAPDQIDEGFLVAHEWLIRRALLDESLLPALDHLKDRLIAGRRDTEEIIVPTGQLFIEALPGDHAVLEDFKLLHRQLDAEKVDAEVRAAYLDAVRAASRLRAGDFEDPDVERSILVRGAANIDVDVPTE
jgi:hypothetical protein